MRGNESDLHQFRPRFWAAVSYLWALFDPQMSPMTITVQLGQSIDRPSLFSDHLQCSKLDLSTGPVAAAVNQPLSLVSLPLEGGHHDNSAQRLTKVECITCGHCHAVFRSCRYVERSRVVVVLLSDLFAAVFTPADHKNYCSTHCNTNLM